jgi:hypothetical protein
VSNEVPAMSPELKRELRIKFLSAALAGIGPAASAAIYKTLNEKQRKFPDLAAAIVADKLARAAVYVLESSRPSGDAQPETEGGTSWGS